MTKWLIVSAGGGVLIAATLMLFPDAMQGACPPSIHVLTNVALWPVAICERLVGPGPAIGPPSQRLHEATPVQFLAGVAGVGISWIFYSSLALLVMARRSDRTKGAKAQITDAPNVTTRRSK